MNLSVEMAEAMVETAMPWYGPHLDKADHHEMAAATFGELMEGEPAESQMADMGMLVAVLFWKLAEARGKLAEVRGAVQDPHA